MALLMPDEEEYITKKTELYSMKNSPAMIDVGCNKGSFTENFYQYYPQAKVIAFEPIVELAVEVQEKFTEKDFHIFPVGVGECMKTSDFYNVGRASECSGVYPRENFAGDHTKIPVITLDSIIPLVFDSIDYLKIDVEGNEKNVLLGAKYIIDNKFAKYIQFEYGDCYSLAEASLNDVIKILYPNYKIYHPDYGYVDEEFNLDDGIVRNFLAEARV